MLSSASFAFLPVFYILEHGAYGGGVPRQPFYAQFVRLVVRYPQIVLGGEQRILCLLQMQYGLVYLLYRGLKAVACDAIVAGKALLEGVYIVLEIRQIAFAVAYDTQLAAVRE